MENQLGAAEGIRHRPSGPREQAATPAQTELADRLADLDGPASVAELAVLTGQHENTVREHLDGLIAAGRVSRYPRTRGRRGRPAYVYSVTRTPAAHTHLALVTALTAHLRSTSPDPGHAAETLGRRAAESQSADPPPGNGTPAAVTGPPAVREALRRWGFAPTAGTAAIRLEQCPLLDVARIDPEVICGFHRGLTRGLAERAGLDPQQVELLPFAEPGACVLTLPA